jgi:phage FluMu protein Com
VPIVKKGTPEKVQNVIVANEEFEKRWAALKTKPVRCVKCSKLIAKSSQGQITIQKKGLAAIVDGSGTADIVCSYCGTINKFAF